MRGSTQLSIVQRTRSNGIASTFPNPKRVNDLFHSTIMQSATAKLQLFPPNNCTKLCLYVICICYYCRLPTSHFDSLFLCHIFVDPWLTIQDCVNNNSSSLVSIELCTDSVVVFEWPAEEHYGSPDGCHWKALRRMDLSLLMRFCLTAPYTDLLVIKTPKNW